jgi:hypothetical protein
VIDVLGRITRSSDRAEALAKLARKRVETTPSIGRRSVIAEPMVR